MVVFRDRFLSMPNRCTALNCSNVILHYLALGKVPFWLVAGFAYVTSYTASLFRTSPPSRPHLLERRTATTPGISRCTLFEWCGGYLTSQVDVLNMEGTLRRGLRLIVLIREDLKSNHFLMYYYLRYKVALIPQVFWDPECWQPEAQPTEPSVHGWSQTLQRTSSCTNFQKKHETKRRRLWINFF